MTGRYELRDRLTPGRGQRYTDLDRARKALAEAVGDPARWYLYDRLARCEVTA